MTQLTSGTVSLATFTDMRNRYNTYVSKNNSLPGKISLVKGGVDYVTLQYFDVMVANYDKYVKAYGTKPNTVEITLKQKTYTPVTPVEPVTPSFGVGYFVNPDATPKPDYALMKKQGITEVYYRIYNSNYSTTQSVLKEIQSTGLKAFAWTWQGFLYTKQLSDMGWNICCDIENYDMTSYFEEIKKMRADCKGKTFILCTKAQDWDGDQKWDVIKDYCDYLMPMLYVGDYNKTIGQLTDYMKQFNTKYPGKVYPALETYLSDNEVTPKSKSAIEAEVAAVKPYCKGVGLFRYGLSNYGTTEVADDGWRNVPSYTFDYQDTGYTCGPTSMSMGLTELFPGTGSRESELAKYAGTTSSGTSHEGMKAAFLKEMEKMGYKGTYAESSLSSMTQTQLGEILKDPDIFIVAHGMTGGWKEGGWINNYGHYVYPIGVNIKTGQYKIADPTKGVITYSKSGFEAGLKMISQNSYLIFKVIR